MHSIFQSATRGGGDAFRREKPDMPLIDGKAERGVFDLELASQRRLAASRQSNYQVKCCHRPASPNCLYI